jgi:hypothetical protein
VSVRLRWAAAAALLLGLVLAALLWPRHPGRSDPAPSATDREPPIAPDRVGKRTAGRVPRFRTEVKPVSPHSQALRAKREASANGTSVPRTAALYEAEARDPVWAAAMESALAGRFHRARALFPDAGLGGVEVKQSCRTSTCRLEVEYTEETVDRIRALGSEDSNPYGYLLGQTGPFSQSSSDESPQPMAVVDNVTRYRKVIHLAFGEQDSRPGQYEAWYTEVKRRWDEARARSGPVVRRRGVPSPEEMQP